MTGAILAFNAGSSSVKFSLYRDVAEPAPDAALCSGEVSGTSDGRRFKAAGPGGESLRDDRLPGASLGTTVGEVLAWIAERFADVRLTAAGHRVVHGGSRFTQPVVVDDAVLREIEALVPLDPLHLPTSLEAMRAFKATHERVPQVACFDTAFHATQSARTTTYALPRALTAEGVRRYGFHGLSYEYISRTLCETLGERGRGRTIAAHLGHGASLCAMRDGRSVATTMGFSVLDGIPMSTRPGQLDPGAILYLLQTKGMSASDVSDLLYKRSGLLGISGVSDDVRTLVASDDPHAAEALDIFVDRAAREIGSLAAALEGLDVLVFAGGIGEHASDVRARIAKRAGWLGVRLDDAANATGTGRISHLDSAVEVWVIATDEQVTIARHTAATLATAASATSNRE